MTEDKRDLLDGSCVELSPQDTPDALSREAKIMMDAGRNSIGTFEAVVVKNKLWMPGTTLDVHFMNGTDAQKSAFIGRASKWMNFANVLLKFDQPASSSEIRVSFGDQGNRSYVGTDNLSIAKANPTMHIQNMSSTEHEMGHALGMMHEHQSPSSTIKWNKPVVYRALGGAPNFWGKDKVDFNVIDRLRTSVTQFTAFDPKSVMLYFFPAIWTLDGKSTTDNEEISEVDADFMSRCYPGCTVDFSHPNIATAGMPTTGVTIGPGTFYNAGYGKSWLMHQPGASYIELRVDQPEKYDGDDVYTSATLKMVHLTSMNGSNPGHSPITITVNGKVVANGHSPQSGGYVEEKWDVSSMMADGENVIRVDFDSGAKTNYWIQTVALECERAFD